MPFVKYNAKWADAYDALAVEMTCIRKGGQWKNKAGEVCGNGLEFHYRQMKNIIWPHLEDHRWSELCLKEILKNKVTVIAGAKSTGKTNSCWIFLCEYFCFPDETLVLCSSTGTRELRMRVWGEISSLWSSAKQKFDFLPGSMIDSRIAITTDTIEEDKEQKAMTARDMRKGIVGVPTQQNGSQVGLKNWIGIKQKRVRVIADECQAMGGGFLDAFSNLDGNVSFKAICLGNPTNLYDPLGRAAEPDDGWSTHLHPDKTAVWKTRFMDGTCINLVGTDSPNFDYPQDQPSRFPYLIDAEKIESTRKYSGKDSFAYYSQCLGVFKIGTMSKCVLSPDMCRQFSAQSDVVWMGTERIKIYGLDSSYGGDKCVGGAGEFGTDQNGNIVLAFEEPHEIEIRVGLGEPEDQIAKRVRDECEARGIPPSNVFHDSTGRGSLGTSFARLWSSECNPIEFGGRPTDRPVSLDMFIVDPVTKMRRLMRCDEHYDRFVTELWFSVRYAVEASQIRRLPELAREDLCLRLWDDKNGKKSVEPKNGTATKPGMKQRINRSPDWGDWCAVVVEGARRLGFEITKLGKNLEISNSDDFFKTEAKRYKTAIQSNLLKHA